MPLAQKAAYAMLPPGSRATSHAAMIVDERAGSPLVICTQFVPPFRVRYKPLLVAAKAMLGFVGWTARRKKPAPVNSGSPCDVHVAPPFEDMSTPAPR